MKGIVPTISNLNWKYVSTEFFIVVAGILAAFTWDAWWDRRREETRVVVYLEQIVAELRESEADLQLATGRMRVQVIAAAQLSRASYAVTPPSEDELRQWMSTNMYYHTADITMGTLRAMVTSGDINLLPDQQLRTKLSVIVDRVADYQDWARAQITEWLLPAWHDMHAFVKFPALQFELTPQDSVAARAARDSTYLLPAGARIQAFPFNLTRELRNPAFHDVMLDTYVARVDLLNQTEAVLGDLAELRRGIEAWLLDRR